MASKMAISRCSEELRNQLKACKTLVELNAFMTKFVLWVQIHKITVHIFAMYQPNIGICLLIDSTENCNKIVSKDRTAP